MKKPEGKFKPSLLYNSFIEEVARVREYGIAKHGSEEGWFTTMPIEHIDAAIRHLLKAKEAFTKSGDKWEKNWYDESGYSHFAHAACNCMFEIERLARNREDVEDSRSKQ